MPRREKDSLGPVTLPDGALYGAQTQRAVENFPISGLALPRQFLRALGLIKVACAQVNTSHGALETTLGNAIAAAAFEVARGEHDDQFPVDVFQTGSGTSTNMNANEVIASLASNRANIPVHPNDHVNYGQSSNDVIPTAIHVSAALAVSEQLLPALKHLAHILSEKRQAFAGIVKNGRTHLMDAMPVRVDQEWSAWQTLVEQDITRIQQLQPELHALAIGGTAVGTGVNATAEFGPQVAASLSEITGELFTPATNRFAAISGQATAHALSGHLKTAASNLFKISNDLRWMNSGPLAGLGEITLPALQPGSSIMPGKINPVIPEAVAMVAAQITGNDATVTMAAQAGNFQLNTMLPVIAYNLLQSIELLANGATVLADKALAGTQLNRDTLHTTLAQNPVLVTALNPVIGYEKSAEIAKKAYAENRPVLEVATEMTDLPREQLAELLDPYRLT
ncbi:class II fumarate hydratase [Teredinibacter turnerae]|uniref:class II fumarate hydratase n=1 Tax=Teredinibacter turnerae TaxID=2426 RepID=UPI00036F02D2|nr:class II fumarate hydratase [Teredinibacter turnerae]